MSPLQATIVNGPTYDNSGPTDAPAIVLVHGCVVTRKMWLAQLRDLSDSFHVIAPDLPGHGALADSPFTFSSAAQTLAEVIRQEASGRALVAGLSLGAMSQWNWRFVHLNWQRDSCVRATVLSSQQFSLHTEVCR